MPGGIYDLTGKKIRDTYPRVLQIDSGSVVRNGFGDPVDLSISGSLIVSGGISGTVTNAVSSSYAVTASYSLSGTSGTSGIDGTSGTSGLSGTSGISTYGSAVVLTFTSSDSWYAQHNLNQKYVNFEAFNSNDEVIIPQNITSVNSNLAIVDFTVPQSGSLSITYGTTNTEISKLTIVSNYTSSDSDRYIFVTSSDTNILLGLANNFENEQLIIKMLESGVLNIYTSGSDLIEFETSAQLTEKGSAINLVTSGSNWFIV